MTDLIVVAV